MLHPDYAKDFKEVFGESIDKVEVTEDIIKNIGANCLKVF